MADGPIDVVIPVYEAPELTRACIESLYARVGHRVGEVWVHDNASGPETARMLDKLDFPRLRVHHARQNTGFGDAVNQGVARTRSEWVLVLNSDVEAGDDFLAPLVEALRVHAELAAVTPAGNTFESYDLGRYANRQGCVRTHNLYAYAFLVRRAAFLSVGGFDRAFGLGYYEDSDLSRKLIATGAWLAVHTGSTLNHAIHGSFASVPEMRELMARNRRLYFERYPRARRRVLLLSRSGCGTELSKELHAALEETLEDGAEVSWLASEDPREMLALGMRGMRGGAARALRLLMRRRRKAYGRFTDVWVGADAPPGTQILATVARRLGLEVRSYA